MTYGYEVWVKTTIDASYVPLRQVGKALPVAFEDREPAVAHAASLWRCAQPQISSIAVVERKGTKEFASVIVWGEDPSRVS